MANGSTEHNAEARRATTGEAQDLVIHAIEFYDSNRQEAAFTAFNEGSNGFIDHDLYIFGFGPKEPLFTTEVTKT